MLPSLRSSCPESRATQTSADTFSDAPIRSLAAAQHGSPNWMHLGRRLFVESPVFLGGDFIMQPQLKSLVSVMAAMMTTAAVAATQQTTSTTTQKTTDH